MLAANDAHEPSARELASELARRRELPPVFRQRLASIRRFTRDDYHVLTVCGLPVFLSKTLGDPARPVALLERWLAGVPVADLVDLARLYVTAPVQDRYWGEYLRILSQIVLVWRSNAESSARARLATEFTLYHEIGHHTDKAERLTRPEEEARADAYALARLRAAHPVLRGGFLGRLAVLVATGRIPKEVALPAA